MTLSTLVVLAAGLAVSGPGTAAAPAAAKRTPAREREASRPEVTCALRIVHAPEAIDAGVFAPSPVRLGNRQAFDDAIVRDSVSPCAGITTRRASGSGGLQR